MAEASEPIADPLAGLAYAGGRPAHSAILKQQPEDFRVDEELGFQLSGQGEHLWLLLGKRGIGTLEAARRLAEAAGVAPRDIGYSGMKDRVAVTSQWFSLRTAAEADTLAEVLAEHGLTLLAAKRNGRKLKIGSHGANRFQLLLRNVRGHPEALEQRLSIVAQQGFPNYFGIQRFGRESSNLAQLDALIGRETRAGRLDRKRRGLLISAARSLLFNYCLSERVTRAVWNTYLPGDVLALANSKSLFRLGASEPWEEQLHQRLLRFDISPTGPLYGQPGAKSSRYEPQAEAADMESRVLSGFQGHCGWLEQQQVAPGRRSLRARPEQLSWHWRQPDQLELHFILVRGAYATSMLRELVQL